MPTKLLPDKPSLPHLKHQVSDLIRDHRREDPAALQRIREFHPKFHKSEDAEIAGATLTRTDACLAIAREYGFASWARLKSHVESEVRQNLEAPHHERIQDPIFRKAVDLLDVGDAKGLKAHLEKHPRVARQRVLFEGGNYFRNPSLLEFCAENPIRHGRLPANIVEIARVILDAGAKKDQTSLDETLGLVASGRVPRECEVQVQLIDLLCDYGANTASAALPAAGHGEFEALETLVRRGLRIDLMVAAATGRAEHARREFPRATPEERHRALALASQFGHVAIVRLLLDAGEDPNRYNPVGAHAHSTPLHQAALAGHLEVVRLLVERGARLDLKDTLFGGTPLGWAEHGKQQEVAEYLRGLPG